MKSYKHYYEYSEKYNKLYYIVRQKEHRIRLSNNQTSVINKLINEIPEQIEKNSLYQEYKEWFQKRYAADSLWVKELKPSYLKDCKYVAFYVIKDDIFNRSDRFIIYNDNGYSLCVNGEFQKTTKTFKPIIQEIEKWFGNCRIQPIIQQEYGGY